MAHRSTPNTNKQNTTRKDRPTQGIPGRQGRDQIALKREVDALARRQRRTKLLAAAAAAVLVVAGVVVALAVSGGPSTTTAAVATVSGPPGPEGVPLEAGPLLASASSAAGGQPVDGIQCNSREKLAYHVHTHLSVYVDGQLRPVPPGIGIVSPVAGQTAQGTFYQASQCYYWLHVHAQDGVIHIESPAGHSYTLGNFFDLWGQPLNTDQVGPARGPLTVFVNGTRYRGDPRTISLGSHVDIQIDVGAPAVAPKSVDWSQTSL
jgi:hypothetical protein